MKCPLYKARRKREGANKKQKALERLQIDTITLLL